MTMQTYFLASNVSTSCNVDPLEFHFLLRSSILHSVAFLDEEAFQALHNAQYFLFALEFYMFKKHSFITVRMQIFSVRCNTEDNAYWYARNSCDASAAWWPVRSRIALQSCTSWLPTAHLSSVYLFQTYEVCNRNEENSIWKKTKKI